MVKKYFVGCRIDKQLFNKVKTHDEQSSTIVREALGLYFMEKEPNNTSPGYTRELVDVLNNQITDLKNDKHILQNRLDFFMLPWFQRLLLPRPKE